MLDVNEEARIEKRVIDEVARVNANGSKFTLADVQKNFLGGSLYTITFVTGETFPDGTPKEFSNRVYVHGEVLKLFRNDQLLLSILGETHTRSRLAFFGDTKIIAGAIATAMTLLVVWVTLLGIYRGAEIAIPPLVANGWLLIVGFYFGKIGSKID